MRKKVNFNQEIKIYKSFVSTIEKLIDESSTQASDMILSATESDIGKWYYNDCKVNFGHIDEIKLLEFKHIKLHKIAGEINGYALDNNIKMAKDYFDDLAKTALDINKLLLKAQQTLNEGIIDEKEYKRNLNIPLITNKKHAFLIDIDPDGIIVLANDDFLNATGFSEQELMGQKFTFVHSIDMPSIIYKYLFSGIKTKDISPCIIKFKSKSGKFFWALVNSRIFEKEDGEIDIISFKFSTIEQQIIDEHIIPLYTKLKQIENQIDIDSSTRYFASYLKDKNRSYEDFVTNLIATGKNDKFFNKKGVFGATLKLFNL